MGAALLPGSVVALVGELGAGKTHLVKGIAVELGVASEKLVNSPTFVLVNEYAGRIPIIHVDAYRLAGAAQLAAIGFDEMCARGGVVLVEWADRVRSEIPASAIWIEITIGERDERQIRVRSIIVEAVDRLRRHSAGLDLPDGRSRMGKLVHQIQGIDYQEQQEAHRHSSLHRAELSRSSNCGCFHCGSVFPPSEIREWIDRDPAGVGQTALCPKCGIDSIIGEAAGFPIELEFLTKMRAFWFG